MSSKEQSLLINKYKVFNLIEDVSALKVLLILESPHINEYIHQHPAAGESALELTQFLKSQGYLHDFNNQLPIGCNIKTQHYTALGILNCSTLPMNAAFYPCALPIADLSQVQHLVNIKNSLAAQNLPSDANNSAYRALADSVEFADFAQCLTHVLDAATPNLIIVPCGDTATGFMTAFAAHYSEALRVLDSLPHPTEPDWAEKICSITSSGYLNRAIPQHLLP
ncbi:hypothetical protein [Psychrobacter sp. 16-MNA-CIBAN-0192]|uniref:hypothetical protein n=1 Tax=Psychrobacter sp. 16-MNA-CIBAN-0192 TaxID=3140448 RepID=UPI00332B0AA6